MSETSLDSTHAEYAKLIRLTQDDDQLIYQAITTNRKFLNEWLPFVSKSSLESIHAFIVSTLHDLESETYTIWHNNVFAGLIGIKFIDRVNMKCELGYWLIEEMTGKGIMTESAIKIIDYCFDHLKINRIQIKCAVGNHKSNAIPKRLGFTFEGIERCGEKNAVGYYDLETYSLLGFEI